MDGYSFFSLARNALRHRRNWHERRFRVEAAKIAFDALLTAGHAWPQIANSRDETFNFLVMGDAFPTETFTATGLALMRVVIRRPDDGNCYDIMVGRSCALTILDWLLNAARDYGCKDILNPQVRTP